MPISVSTMRDLWDKARKQENEALSARLHRINKVFPEEIQYYFYDYAARKRAFEDHKSGMTQIFSRYKECLDKGGFLSID